MVDLNKSRCMCALAKVTPIYNTHTQLFSLKSVTYTPDFIVMPHEIPLSIAD